MSLYPSYGQVNQQMPNQIPNQMPTQIPSQQMMPMQMPKMEMPINNGNFVPVANENVARNYPVAYGNTVIFKDENAPYIYIKAMGYSQLESPVFEKYKREEQQKQPNTPIVEQSIDNVPLDEIKADIEEIKGQIKSIKEQMFNNSKSNNVTESKGGNRR